MPRGRPPLPPELKLIAGARKDRINDKAPELIEDDFEPPETLDKIALAEWKRIVPDLRNAGVLSKTDRAALEIYCETYSQWRQAIKLIQTKGITVVDDETGEVKVAPWYRIAETAGKACRALLEQFGCTPSSRGRVKAEKESEKDEFEELMSRRGG